MKYMYYLEDAKGNIVGTNDGMKWSNMLGDIETRRVCVTQLVGMRVSTVFLGIDHGLDPSAAPLLYERMVFSDLDSDDDDRRLRYATRDEAQRGHDNVVLLLREGATNDDGD